jgi:hypothetical protein
MNSENKISNCHSSSCSDLANINNLQKHFAFNPFLPLPCPHSCIPLRRACPVSGSPATALSALVNPSTSHSLAPMRKLLYPRNILGVLETHKRYNGRKLTASIASVSAPRFPWQRLAMLPGFSSVRSLSFPSFAYVRYMKIGRLWLINFFQSRP